MRQVLINAELLFAAMCLISAQPVLVQAAALNQSSIVISPLMPFDATNFTNSDLNNSSSLLLKSAQPNQLPTARLIYGNFGGDLLLGNIKYGDRLLSNEVFLRFTASYDYYTTYHLGYQRISAIRIYNHNLNGATARVSIWDGGVGYSYAMIVFQSLGNSGFKFTVQIYGH